MTAPTISVGSRRNASPAEIPASTTRRVLSHSTAASVVLFSSVLATIGDLLLHESVPGLGFSVWIALLAIAMVPLVWRAGLSIPREAAMWLATAVAFAVFVAWRDSDTLEFFNGCAAVGALLMAAVATNDSGSGLFARRLRDTAGAVLAAMRGTGVGILPLAFRELFSSVDTSAFSHRTRRFGRVAVIAAPLVLVFGSLLRSADPIFASLVALPGIDFGDLAPHLIVIAILGWLIAGWARNALLPVREPTASTVAGRFQLDTLEITTALGTLNVLFGAFVVAQLGWLFGGEHFLHDRTGLTAAEYARHGFFQMLLIVVLVVPLLVATRVALRPGRDIARRHTALALPMVGLVGAIILSAVLRMRLYVHYYGLSTERFYPLVCMGWLAAVLVWLAITVLRGWGRPFVAGSVISGLIILAALNVAAPDAMVARINVSRTRLLVYGVPDLDIAYLATLSGEAAPIAINAVLAPPVGRDGTPARLAEDSQRCSAARSLISRWGPSSAARQRRDANAAWRSWNSGEAAAVNAVEAHAAAVWHVQHATCPTPRVAEHRP